MSRFNPAYCYRHVDHSSHFGHFKGHKECGFTSRDLYAPPSLQDGNTPKHTIYCRNRATLLEAMSGGGRHGFERPYTPAGCHYRWYSTAEICMILERFDAVVFIGDDTLKHIYAAFNMLLREDLALGGLDQRDLVESDRNACRCENQFMRPECSSHIVMESQASSDTKENVEHGRSYHCDRKSYIPVTSKTKLTSTGTPHMFLPTTGSPASEDLHSRFNSLLTKDPDGYKPIPVVQSLSLGASLSWSSATSSMDEWVSMADSSSRNVPFLWTGPNAAGHLKPPGQILSEGNSAIWHYTLETAKEAKSRELDALGMYNLTLQADSWDGTNYGLKVGLVQAMMVSMLHVNCQNEALLLISARSSTGSRGWILHRLGLIH